MSGSNPSMEKGVGVTTLSKLFDLTPMRIQQLATAGVVVKAGHGRYLLGESVRGYVKFLRERAETRGGSRELSEVKRLIAEEDLESKRRENAADRRENISTEKMRGMVRTATLRWDSALKAKLITEVPARVVGKDAAEVREEMRLVHGELGQISREMFIDEIEPELVPIAAAPEKTEEEEAAEVAEEINEADADDLSEDDS